MPRPVEEWLSPRRPRDHFPPYSLADRDLVSAAEDNTRKLARLYHVAHDQAWNGRQVLADLVARHGGIHFPPDKQEAMGRIGAVLLWGELAAWSISADLALSLEDTDAKMAASSQVFDEARHFYVLRDYLWQAGIPLPRLGGFSRKVLVDLLETDKLLYKVVGMQLMVENIALCVFRALAEAKLEPVLSDLLYYFERDEARHVGLGALTLPSMLPQLSEIEAAQLWLYQLKLQLMLIGGGIVMNDAFDTLGIDQVAMQVYGDRLHRDVMKRMRGERQGTDRHRATRGVFTLGSTGQERFNRFLFPEPGTDRRPWQRVLYKTMIRAAFRGDQWLAARSP